MRLQSKILVLLLPITLLPLLGLGGMAYHQLLGVSERHALDQMQVALEQVKEDFDELRETARANLGLFASAAIMEKYLLTENPEDRYALMQPGLLRLLAKYQDAYPDYCQLAVLDQDGLVDSVREIKVAGTTCMGSLPADFVSTLRASQEDVYETLMPAMNGNGARMLIGQRIRLRDAATAPVLSQPIARGYLVMVINLSRLQVQVNEHRIGVTGFLYVSDAHGRVMYSPGDVDAPELQDDQLSAISRGEVLHAKVKNDLLLLQGRRLYERMLLISALPEAELISTGRALRWTIVVITTLGILLSAGLLVGVLRWLVLNPLSSLSHAAVEVGQGNLNVKVAVNSGDEIGALANAFRDMTGNLRHSNAQISYLAYHDDLTGLPNRLMFMEGLERSIQAAKRGEQRLALLFLDVDDFKRLNDTLGHHAGDAFLSVLAESISGVLRGKDVLAHGQSTETVARLGGDEFLIMLEDVADAAAAGKVAQRVLNVFAESFQLDGHEFHVSASIGITLYPDDGADVETLIKNADIAMYQAKALGKNNFQFFDESLNTAAVHRLALENALRKAVERDELLLHYQPLVDIHAGQVIGFEALLRWQHPTLGMVPPDSFIPLAEETGLILPIGAWVMEEACRQIRRWRDESFTALHVSVNVSSIQISKQDVPALIHRCLLENDVPPTALVVEITESSLMSVRQSAMDTLEAIRALGVSISLDDFGTGYSSLSYLRRFPINTLKIDKSFVRDISLDAEDAAIIRAIVAMGHSLGLEIVAEGVETVMQWEFLRGHGCDIAQGYLFSRPLPAAEATKMLSQPVANQLMGQRQR